MEQDTVEVPMDVLRDLLDATELYVGSDDERTRHYGDSHEQGLAIWQDNR